jgi:hypothetical protein
MRTKKRKRNADRIVIVASPDYDLVIYPLLITRATH